VKVTLRRRGREAVAALERAGLRVAQVADRFVVGTVEVARLAALAELRQVERVALPECG
jgi:hypothetical protein